MSFIYQLKLSPRFQEASNWDEASNLIMESHFAYLKSLHEEGKATFVGRTDYPLDHADLFGLCVLKVEGVSEAEEIMQNDPAVKNGIMHAKIHPFKTIFSH
ncbi:MAG: hypothetical protein KA797_08615 [Chitinophagales bacterium]|nr:hypothetical protein [Chitinophagales bacterium]